MLSYKEKYLTDVELQILYCIKESPKDVMSLRGKFNMSVEDARAHMGALRRYGLIEPLCKDSNHNTLWTLSKTVLRKMKEEE